MPHFVRATVFTFILDLRPICGELPHKGLVSFHATRREPVPSLCPSNCIMQHLDNAISFMQGKLPDKSSRVVRNSLIGASEVPTISLEANVQSQPASSVPDSEEVISKFAEEAGRVTHYNVNVNML